MSPEGLAHRDITSERRPEWPGPTTLERTRSKTFAKILEKTLSDYYDAHKKEDATSKPTLSSIEFFFKKQWDAFSEPLLEYDDLKKSIDEGAWESNGAKSRALNELNSRRSESLRGIQTLAPEFEKMSDNEKKKLLARLYEGYASFIHTREDKMKKLAEWVGEGSSYGVERFLRTIDDELMRTLSGKRSKKKAKKEAGVSE